MKHSNEKAWFDIKTEPQLLAQSRLKDIQGQE